MASTQDKMKLDTTDRLSTHVCGDGRRIVAGLHGWNGSHATFAPLEDRVPASSRLVGIDLAGYGDSPAPPKWDLPTIGAQIAATLEGLDDEAPVDLVGSCSGGVIALFVAPLIAERLDRFIFLEPFAYVPGYLSLFTKPIVGRFFYYAAFGNPVGRVITNAALAGHRGDDTDMTASFSRGSIEVPLRYLHLFDAIDEPESFADLPGQIELVYGEHTFDAIRESVDIWKEVWPHARRREITGAGHLLLEEAPEKVANAIFEES